MVFSFQVYSVTSVLPSEMAVDFVPNLPQFLALFTESLRSFHLPTLLRPFVKAFLFSLELSPANELIVVVSSSPLTFPPCEGPSARQRSSVRLFPPNLPSSSLFFKIIPCGQTIPAHFKSFSSPFRTVLLLSQPEPFNLFQSGSVVSLRTPSTPFLFPSLETVAWKYHPSTCFLFLLIPLN